MPFIRDSDTLRLDLPFLVIYSLQFIFYFYNTTMNFVHSRYEKTMSNYLMSFFIYFFLMFRIATIVTDLTWDHDFDLCRREYVIIQVEQDLLNMAVIAEGTSWYIVYLSN